MRLKRWAGLLLVLVFFFSLAAILNIPVTTRQGIDYRVYSIKMPLYLKTLDFLDRHYNYALLVKRITGSEDDEEKRILMIFEWTFKHIKPQPSGLPVVDDHVWNIIVRGYGAGEQSSDVFTTLCNYAGADAFYLMIYDRNDTEKMPFSFVKVKGRWVVFDEYHGSYFKNREGMLASIEELKGNNWTREDIGGADRLDFDYKDYFMNLPEVKGVGLRRANIQSPFRRLIFEVKRWLR